MAGAPQRDDLTRYRRQPALGDGGSFMSSSITQKIRPVCNYVRKGVVCAPGPRALRRGTKRKKRGLRPERSGGSPARGASLGILPWTSTVKPFCGFSVQRDADPHGYKEKRVDIYFVNPSWWSRGESNPCPKALPQELLRAQTVHYIPSLRRGPTHS